MSNIKLFESKQIRSVWNEMARIIGYCFIQDFMQF